MRDGLESTPAPCVSTVMAECRPDPPIGPMADSKPRRGYVGISGYNYRGWRGNFYPPDLPVRGWLGYASRIFNSIELNGTFYSLKTPAIYRRWAAETPPGFVFAIKGSRFITHNKKLKDAGPALANFFASGILELGPKCGPFLWQLPATGAWDRARTEAFLRLLPRDSAAGARLARKHEARIVTEAATRPGQRRRWRHAIEPRHSSWFTAESLDLLARFEVALVFADTAGRFPTASAVTADFLYARLHGSETLYTSRYRDEELDEWAERLDQCAGPARDIHVYFDNDARGHAPHDARRLAQRLEQRGIPVTTDAP